MQRSVQLARTLRATSLPVSRRFISVPAPEPGFPTGEEFLARKEAVKHHAAGTTSLWKNISILVCLPVIAGGTYWVIETEKKHAAHKAEHPHEYIDYPYLNRRPRQFPWGPNSLFFNPHVQKDMSQSS
ncbi:SubName: Full=Uncharacterized protein {ECO:0000313/EMBL:CCA77914.1} [Serendipita indica DSM 11827]|uniref:Uncharacterized protein n=1 Tax=Serendipita indica (strain DSM 11827) TaxID=1109443 RepID=G4U2V5_SERID|nr:SubName: Full=Uncharacterized protein {ECO:0000313/EMBL:CCA77914.1} [Serendipita indica DSM 11827]CCA77914.1 hypothetical protein PIIN_08737 [Serendipita indica DSM 11827]